MSSARRRNLHRRAALVLAVAFGLGAGMPQSHARTTAGSPQIVDPLSDANHINDAGESGHRGTPFFGNVVTDPDLDNATDIIEVWFSNDSTTISAHVRVEAQPDYEGEQRQFTVLANPGAQPHRSRDCVVFAAVIGTDGPYLRSNYATVGKLCEAEYVPRLEVDFTVDTLSDGSGLISITAPRTFSPYFARGARLQQPWAKTILGGNFTPIDTTVRGADYSIKR